MAGAGDGAGMGGAGVEAIPLPSALTADMPQITASTARRSMARLANSRGE